MDNEKITDEEDQAWGDIIHPQEEDDCDEKIANIEGEIL